MIRKTGYPRPQFERTDWQNLNGEWEFAFDDEGKGLDEKWYEKGVHLERKIQVPFVYQSALSGIGDRSAHDIVWYKRKAEIARKDSEERVLLHFGAVDYRAQVYVNGKFVVSHAGGYTPFSADITRYLEGDVQEITVRVYDPHADEFIPRGKQFWDGDSRGIWYTNSTGIWQTVWLERVPEKRLENAKFTSLYDEGKVNIRCRGRGIREGDALCYRISLRGETAARGELLWNDGEADFTVDLIRSKVFNMDVHEQGISWTPEHPVLFDVEFVLKDSAGQEKDYVRSYFGFRKIHTKNGMVYLNNKPYYQKLVLNQGYWPEGLLTAPDDAALKRDIRFAKDMGFNGCRMHQKIEEPRFLYWADRLGFLVWGESASAAMYSECSAKRIMDEWAEAVERDYNHPCIVAWVPLNESWGVPRIGDNRMQQSFSLAMYYFLHAIDDTRLVVSNDGWEMTRTDICAIHNYRHGQKGDEKAYREFCRMLSTREKLIGYPSTCREIYAEGYQWNGEPIMLTEFGGIGFDVSGEPGWGYSRVETEEEFAAEYGKILEAVLSSRGLWGFCYTQLTDVEQEINGLLTYDRRPKCPPEIIRKINSGYHISRIEE